MDDAALSCVVAVLAVVIAVKTFSCAVGGACNRALTRAALDLFYAEMIERDFQPPSFPPLCLSTAILTASCTDGKREICSANAKNSCSVRTISLGKTLSIAAPRVMSR